MRVYSRAEFLKLPEGTLFAKGKPWYWESLHVKGETWAHWNDFLLRDLQWIESPSSIDASHAMDRMLENGTSAPMETAYGRDGCFDDKDLFLVYEPADLDALSEIIAEAKEAAKVLVDADKSRT